VRDVWGTRRVTWGTRLPGVVPVALISSTAIAIVITPIAVWSVRTGMKNLGLYGPILWIVLAAYVVVVIPQAGPHGPYGLFVLGIVGLVVLGFIPVAN
jgi:hypothetical protein